MIEKLTRNRVKKLTGATEKTLRLYEEKGVLHPEKDEQSGYMRYSREDVLRVFDVLVYREVGYSPDQVKLIYESPEYDWKRSLDAQIAGIEDKIKRLTYRMDLARFLRAMAEHEGDRQQSFDTFALLVKYPEFRWILSLFEDEEALASHEAYMDAAALFVNGFPPIEISPEELPTKLTHGGLIQAFDLFDERIADVMHKSPAVAFTPSPAILALLMCLAVCSEYLGYESSDVQKLIGYAVEKSRMQYDHEPLEFLRSWVQLVGPNGIEGAVLTGDAGVEQEFRGYTRAAFLLWLESSNQGKLQAK